MIAADIQKLFGALEHFPGLQRKEWELNQSGKDRGMEAALIQRSPREVATYALVRLRLGAMPDLRQRCRRKQWSKREVRGLTKWGRTQGAGGTMLSKAIEEEWDGNCPNDKVMAALTSLQYYHDRTDENPAVKQPWTKGGYVRIASLDTTALLEYPTRGKFWGEKFETVKDLANYLRQKDFSDTEDKEVLRCLKSIPGVGDQTASMIALFWLGRPVPVLDNYLLHILKDHNLLPSLPLTGAGKNDLYRHLFVVARKIEASCPEWPASRVLSCLYLWVCEVGRLHCTCKTGGGFLCPIRSVLLRV